MNDLTHFLKMIRKQLVWLDAYVFYWPKVKHLLEGRGKKSVRDCCFFKLSSLCIFAYFIKQEVPVLSFYLLEEQCLLRQRVV